MSELLKWCDEKISFLKQQGIKFKNGLPIIPVECLYTDIPLMIETFAHRNDIPEGIKGNSLIAFYNYDCDLLQRIFKIEKEINELYQYGGICGFDISPCITMLKPRQKFSMLVSAVFNCFVAVHGVKILMNARNGYLSSSSVFKYLPKYSNFITGEVGCHNNGFRSYGLYQLKLIRENVQPNIIFVYGHLSKKDIHFVCERESQTFVMYPNRRNRMRNNKLIEAVEYDGKNFSKLTLQDYLKKGDD